MSDRAFGTALTLMDVSRQPVLTQWSYDPGQPLAILIIVLTGRPSATHVLARSLLVAAFAHAPRVVGEGAVRFAVRDNVTMQVALTSQAGMTEMFFTSTQAVLAFGQATLTAVPMCVTGHCLESDCAECQWLHATVSHCSCGMSDCTSWYR